MRAAFLGMSLFALLGAVPIQASQTRCYVKLVELANGRLKVGVSLKSEVPSTTRETRYWTKIPAGQWEDRPTSIKDSRWQYGKLTIHSASDGSLEARVIASRDPRTDFIWSLGYRGEGSGALLKGSKSLTLPVAFPKDLEEAQAGLRDSVRKAYGYESVTFSLNLVSRWEDVRTFLSRTKPLFEALEPGYRRQGDGSILYENVRRLVPTRAEWEAKAALDRLRLERPDLAVDIPPAPRGEAAFQSTEVKQAFEQYMKTLWGEPIDTDLHTQLWTEYDPDRFRVGYILESNMNGKTIAFQMDAWFYRPDHFAGLDWRKKGVNGAVEATRRDTEELEKVIQAADSLEEPGKSDW